MPNVDLISVIEKKLEKYLKIELIKDGKSIIAKTVSEHGFPVLYQYHENMHVVAFEGWHEHFESSEEALNYFFFGLTKKCKLTIHKRGNFSYKWTVERNVGDNIWVEVSTMGLFIFPFWKRGTIIYLQNNITPKRDYKG